nr:MAG TPA: hypothetical protein [Caudoviricetes sp.]
MIITRSLLRRNNKMEMGVNPISYILIYFFINIPWITYS